MLALLLCWVLFLITCLAVGSLIRQEHSFFAQFILGLSLLALALQLWVIFLPVKFFWLLLLFIFILVAILPECRRRFIVSIRGIYESLELLNIVLLLVFLFIASLPLILNDDAAYYQQTIKWFSYFGYVPGIANLKVHFGLGSSWHLISSLFFYDSLPFTRYYNFNGLMLWMLIISLQNHQNKAISIVAMSILPVFGSLFIISPSPDLVILVGVVYIFFHLKNINPGQLAMIVGFLITVKLTAAGLLFFFLPLASQLKDRKQLFGSLVILMGFATLLIIRNIILTGYPLFPITIISTSEAFQIPEIIVAQFKTDVLYDIFDSFIYNANFSYDVNSFSDKFLLLFKVRNYKIILNCLCISSILLVPILVIRQQGKAGVLLALAVFINGMLWFMNAPNYRFFLAYPVILVALLLMILPVATTFFFEFKKAISPFIIIGILMIPFMLNHVIFIVNCGSMEEINTSIILKPSDFNHIEYIDKGAFVITTCAYCFDAPLPCYSGPVFNKYVRKYNFEIAPADPENIKKGFRMYEKPFPSLE